MEDLNPMRTKITGGNHSSIIQGINQYWFKISNKITELNKKREISGIQSINRVGTQTRASKTDPTRKNKMDFMTKICNNSVTEVPS